MFALLLPLLASVVPDIAKWAFGSKGEEVATAATNVVKAVIGSDDPTAVARALDDPKMVNELRVQLAKIVADQEMARDNVLLQMMKTVTDTNNIEAGKDSLFIAGWRPFVGWICAFGVGFASMGVPLIAAFSGKAINVDTGTLIALLTGMLGIGGMRTVEKMAGAASVSTGK